GLADDLRREVVAQGGEQAVQAGGVGAGGVHGSTVRRRPDGVGCSLTDVRRQGSGRDSGSSRAVTGDRATGRRRTVSRGNLAPERKRGPKAPLVRTRARRPQRCATRRIFGVTNTSSSAFSLLRVLRLNRLPRNGMSPRNGILDTSFW